MTKSQKWNLTRLILCALLLAAAFVVGQDTAAGVVLALLAYLAAGYEVLWEAVENLFHGELFDENFLMTIATVGAIVLGEFSEAAAVMILYGVGEWFEGVAVGHTEKSVSALMAIRPDTAVVLRDGAWVTVAPEDVAAGELLSVKPGERIPLDGTVEAGSASIDTASITGESIPRDVAVGDKVYSGTLDLSGTLQIRAAGSYAESTVSRILELAENAAAKKAGAERFITRFARIYTPAVCAFALLLAVVPSLIFGNWPQWIERALLCLMISCPCALVVSVPLAFFSSLGGAAKKGILIKGATDVEKLAAADTAVFDKTGTLTSGRFSVTGRYPSGCDERTLLRFTAAAEAASNHPIARSIMEKAGALGLTAAADTAVEEPGLGIRAEADGDRILAGNARMMRENGVEFPEIDQPGTAVYTAVNGRYLGCIVIGDELKPDTVEGVKRLRRLGIRRTVMLTGDNAASAASAAESAGLDAYHHSLLPADKVAEMEKLLTESAGKVLYVGDGINDVPVLSRADVGIAMGALGSDAAMEAADVVIMDDRLTGAAEAVRIARKTMRIVKENVAFSLLVKFAVLILGALGMTSLWLAVFADVGVLILCILNALRTLK